MEQSSEMIDKTYYNKMLKKGRLIPFIIGDKLIGFVSFYITNDVNKYLRDDPWTVMEDEPETGKVCWVDQVWVKNEYRCCKYSFKIWHRLKQYLKTNYPQVEKVRWNRYRHNITKEYQCTIS